MFMKATSITCTTENPKLKLQSKKLKSGKVQVKFTIKSSEKREHYGYVLTDADTTLKEVVNSIHLKLHMLEDADQYFHQRLYALNKPQIDNSQFLVFQAN